jgi:nucleoid-associated protein YgaU
MFGSRLDRERVFGHHGDMRRTYVRMRLMLILAAATMGVLAYQAVAGEALAGPNVLPVVQRQYVVREGDTLWRLAAQIEPGRDPREIVAQIVSANGVEPGDLVPGQVLVLPGA